MKNLIKKFNFSSEVERIEIWKETAYVMANTSKTLREEKVNFEIPQKGWYNKEGESITKEQARKKILDNYGTDYCFSVKEDDGQINIQKHGKIL